MVLFNMAILLNIISTGSRKSAGAATFRRVRGRTIMSQKRGSNASSIETRAALGLVRTYREAIFYIMSNFCDGMQNSINESFNPTQYGSRRNAFFKLNYSAVELALNASQLGLALLDQVMHNVAFTGVEVTEGQSTYGIDDFNDTGWDNLMSAALRAGTDGSYVRSNIKGTIRNGFDEKWGDEEDPGTGKVTEMVVTVGTATSAGQNIERIVIAGNNLTLPPTYTIKVGSTQATALAGTWQGNTWRPSGDSATQRWTSTYTVYIMDGAHAIYGRDVTFHALGDGAGGE